jgi:hypothetical protein
MVPWFNGSRVQGSRVLMIGRHVVQDDPKLPMMVERYPNLKEKVGGSIPGCEISSLLDGKLAKWSTISCASVQGLQKQNKKTIEP